MSAPVTPAASGKKKYVALLRAVNVAGFGILKMTDLAKAFEAMGFSDVKTYIQTGNVVFATTSGDTNRLAAKIEKGLASSLGHGGKVFVLRPAELKEAAAANPFEPARLEHEQRCHLFFLSGEPSKARVLALMKLEGEEYRFSVRGKVLYYAYPRALEGPRRRSINFEKVLGVAGTGRTWKVVDKLIELSSS